MAVDDARRGSGSRGGSSRPGGHRATSLPSRAPWSTVSGSVTHFIRDGRMSASSRSSRLADVESARPARRAGRAPSRGADRRRRRRWRSCRRSTAPRRGARRRAGPGCARGRRRAGSRPRRRRRAAPAVPRYAAGGTDRGSRCCRAPRHSASSPARAALAVGREAVGAVARQEAAVAERGHLGRAVAARRPGCGAGPDRRWWPARTSRTRACRAPDGRGGPRSRAGCPDGRAPRGGSIRPPSRSSPAKTGSSGSSDPAPAAIRISSPRGEQALHLGRDRPRVARRVAHRQEARAEPVHLLGQGRTRIAGAGAGPGSPGSAPPARAGGTVFTATRPPALHARDSASFTSRSGIASGVILARATTSPPPPAGDRRA